LHPGIVYNAKTRRRRKRKGVKGTIIKSAKQRCKVKLVLNPHRHPY
jgi:hypothetical protein